MVRKKKHDSAVPQKVGADDKDQSKDLGARAYTDPKAGVEVKAPGSGTYHDLQEGVEPKAPGVGVYLDERANALSCVAPATPQAAPVLAESDSKKTDKPPVAETIAKSEPKTAPSESETKE